MGKLEKEVFICLDCETTGLDTDQDRIIELAAVKFEGEKILEKYETLVNPLKKIPQASMDIHHISDEMVADQPLIQDVLPDFLRFVGRSTIVGHGVGFDIEIVQKTAVREGITCTISNNIYIDTVRMARLYGDSPTNSLEQLRKHFNIESDVAHRAMSDVLANVEVFRFLSKTYKTKEKLLDVLSRPILLKEMPLGKHKGRPLKQLPLDYLRWAARKDFDRDLLYSIRTELKRRKGGNTFLQSPFENL